MQASDAPGYNTGQTWFSRTAANCLPDGSSNHISMVQNHRIKHLRMELVAKLAAQVQSFVLQQHDAQAQATDLCGSPCPYFTRMSSIARDN